MKLTRREFNKVAVVAAAVPILGCPEDTMQSTNSILNKRVQLPSFDPCVEIGSCSLWLDAADTSTITTSGNEVTQWNDKASGGFTGNFTPYDSNRPLSGSKINGFNVITFQNDATPRALVSALSGDIKSGSGYSYFVVFKPIDPDGEEIILFKGSSTPSEDLGNEFAAYTGTGGISHRVHTGDATPIFGFTFGPSLSNTDTGYLSYVVDAPSTGIGSASLAESYKNGGFDSSRSDWDSVNDPPSNEGRPYYVGARYDDPQTTLSADYKGDLCEIVVFNKPLNGTERGQMDTYIQDKWGITP